jgi:S1-C subfamily serine protease
MNTFLQLKVSFQRFLKTLKRKEMLWLMPAVVCVSVVSGLAGGVVFEYLKGNLVSITPAENIRQEGGAAEYVPQTTQEQKIIDAVKVVSPSVVSIIITKDVPIIEQYFSNPFEGFFGQGSPFRLQVPQYRQKGTEKKEVGGGSGFIVSADGYVVTNKHVVLDEEADYTVFTNDGKSYPAKVLAKDPLQDLAILKIEEEQIVNELGAFTAKPFVPVRLGDASTLQIGQSVIAIGNALGEFRNTVSVGVISGLGRTITASGGANFVETIEDVIQTDAAINKGNSGGPLLNLAGEVIGINTATVLDAQNIGFAVPINKVKRDIEQVRAVGKITYPLLGVRYVLITETIAKDRNLPVTYGALIEKGDSATPAVTIGSAADKAGMREGDIILEFNGERVSPDNSLAKLIQKYNPKDTVVMKVLRGEEEKILQVTLGERSE